MKVVDERDSTKFLPIVEIVDEIVPLFRKQHFVGIRRLVLLDEDYRRGRGAAGRYCPVKGSDQADIETFFSHLAGTPRGRARQPGVLSPHAFFFITVEGGVTRT